MLISIVTFLNSLANAIGSVVLAPVAWVPGWVSATIIAIVTGGVMLIAFKHTSNQAAVKHARDQIKANMLALSLFKENLGACLRAQGGILWNAVKLLGLAIVPMLAMLIPMVLILGQMSLWYQARPLRTGEEVNITVQLAPGEETLPEILLRDDPNVEVKMGPVRIVNDRQVCWTLVPREAGYQQLVFESGKTEVTKELSVGDGLMRVSLERPGQDWSAALLSPWEKPLAKSSVIQSVAVEYPRRDSWTSGTDAWVIYWFAVSMVAAFALRKPLNVSL